MKKVLLFTVFICATAINSHAQSKAPAKSEVWKTYSKDNYSVKYPNNWKLDATGSYGTTFFLFSPLTAKTDGFRESVNLVIQDLAAQPMGLDEYMNISKEQLKNALPNVNVIEAKKLNNKNGEYGRILYTGEQQSFHLKFLQHFWIINNKAYVLSYTAEEKMYDTYLKIADVIFNSFIIKK